MVGYEEKVWAEMRGNECSPATVFRRPKMSDDLTDYIVAIVIRWGVKRTPTAMKLGRRSTDNITTPHANFHPIPRTFYDHL